MQLIIGRTNEQERLKRCYESNRSEFVALFGRRRVGKTFLVKALYEPKFIFYAVGLQNGDKTEQITNFNRELAVFGAASATNDLTGAANWHEAFEKLYLLIQSSERKDKKVIFLDEISWMGGTDKSFIAALDHFWNRWISSRRDVLLIICGSATSWIINNVVNNTGGLHNRLTEQIQLMPFTLKECEEYFRARQVPMPLYQILESYMIFGGIPYYLDFFERDKSLAQNVDRIYFAPDAPLRNEYDNLFRALFNNADNYIRVAEALALKRKGLMRKEISVQSGIKEGGTLTRVLTDLVCCGFVREYLAFGKSKRDKLYQLTDSFTLFHLTFSGKQKRYTENYWLHYSITPAHSSWSGYAFELVCLLHIFQIKQALGISGVLTEVSSWRSKVTDPGAQIDMVIERSDGIIHLCEMKFSSDIFTLNKDYSRRLREKKSAFVTETGTRKAAHTTLVTTYGLRQNEYSAEIPFKITINELFV